MGFVATMTRTGAGWDVAYRGKPVLSGQSYAVASEITRALNRGDLLQALDRIAEVLKATLR